MSAGEVFTAVGDRVVDENGLTVAHVLGQDEDNSDAIMLAAAPQMLRTLRSIHAMGCLHSEPPNCPCPCCLARAAIVSAEGENNITRGQAV